MSPACHRKMKILTGIHLFSITPVQVTEVVRGGCYRARGAIGRERARRSPHKEEVMPVGPEKEKAIDLAVSSIEKAFGKGSIMRLGNEDPLVRDIQAISTGSISLDIAL